MNNTLTKSYVTQLPQYTPKLRELQLSIDWWNGLHSEAGSQKEQAWKMYQDAIDNEQPRHIINNLYATAQLFEMICADTWKEWQDAKKQLLDLLN